MTKPEPTTPPAADEPAPPPTTTTYGIRIAERGSAIVGVERTGGARLGTVIEQHPFDLRVVLARVRELDDGKARFVIDSEGLGSALWQLLGEPDDEARWLLFAARGIERQALVDLLIVAIEDGTFHFAPGLANQDSMNRALLSYRRQVGDDGVIGSELVVALQLALVQPPEIPEPFVLFGRPR